MSSQIALRKGHTSRLLSCSAAAIAAMGLFAASASAVVIDFENYPTGAVGTGPSWPQDWSYISGNMPQVVTTGPLAGSKSLEFLDSTAGVFNRVLLDLRPTAKDYTPLGSDVNMSMMVQPGDSNVPTTFPNITIRTLTDAGVANSINFAHGNDGNYFNYYNGATYVSNNPTGFTVGNVYQVDMVLHKTTETWDLKVTDVTAGNTVVYNLQGLGYSSTGFGSENINFLDLVSYVSTGTDDTRIDNINISNVPEPASLSLLGIGGLLLSARKRLR